MKRIHEGEEASGQREQTETAVDAREGALEKPEATEAASNASSSSSTAAAAAEEAANPAPPTAAGLDSAASRKNT